MLGDRRGRRRPRSGGLTTATGLTTSPRRSRRRGLRSRDHGRRSTRPAVPDGAGTQDRLAGNGADGHGNLQPGKRRRITRPAAETEVGPSGTRVSPRRQGWRSRCGSRRRREKGKVRGSRHLDPGSHADHGSGRCTELARAGDRRRRSTRR